MNAFTRLVFPTRIAALAVIIGIGLIFVGSGTSHASILFDGSFDYFDRSRQQDIAFNDLDVCCQRIAEDFSFTSPVIVEGITFRGGYYPTNTPETDSFILTIYNDNRGLPDPGSIVALIVLEDIDRTFTGQNILTDVYHLTASFAGVPLSANTLYWLTIVADTASDTNDDWVWIGLHGAGRSAGSRDGGVSWHADDSQERWFQLEGRVIAPACDNHMSQSIFTLGQNVIADSVRVINSGDSQRVEFKYWTVWPDGATSPRYTSKARGEFVPSGFDREYGPVTLFKVTSDTPVGTYQYNCRVLDPGTGETLWLNQNSFEVQPALVPITVHAHVFIPGAPAALDRFSGLTLSVDFGIQFLSIETICFTSTFSGDLWDDGEAYSIGSPVALNFGAFGQGNILGFSRSQALVCLGRQHTSWVAEFLDGRLDDFSFGVEGDTTVSLSALRIEITGSVIP